MEDSSVKEPKHHKQTWERIIKIEKSWQTNWTNEQTNKQTKRLEVKRGKSACVTNFVGAKRSKWQSRFKNFVFWFLKTGWSTFNDTNMTIISSVLFAPSRVTLFRFSVLYNNLMDIFVFKLLNISLSQFYHLIYLDFHWILCLMCLVW